MPIDLRQLFRALGSQLEERLATSRKVIVHPGEKGEAAELDWMGTLRDYLPWRYQVSKASVVDSDGSHSDLIDVVIHDRQYSPLIFKQGDTQYVPAESVYAVFEVKQELDKARIEYAGRKAASVRRLKRTSTRIPHAGGSYASKDLFTIMAGILCLESAWKPPLGEPFVGSLLSLPEDGRLDLGCALRHGAFSVSYPKDGEPRVESSTGEAALLFFYLRLLKRLQQLGTAPAIDYDEYGKFI